jgi:pyrroloquinoline quinone (PQQ) biosynthesis protein C
MDSKEQLNRLDHIISKKWMEILAQPQAMNFANSLMGKDRRIYAIYLTQVYYYAFHTARNQALVAVNPANTDIKYMQFCLEHALEETGHELMALHDLKAIGAPIENIGKDMPPILPPTELLIAYLYWVSSNGSPVQRLGYSYWAERSYGLIGAFMENLTKELGLEKKQMTFYYSHALIDDKHAKDVEKIVLATCKTEDDWKQITKVAEITIDLTHEILQQVLKEYELLINGKSSDFEILKSISN